MRTGREMDDKSYEALPPETRKFLSGLRPDDIKDITKAVDLMHSIGTVGRFVKWLIVLTAGTFVAASSLGDSFAKVARWFTGSHQ